MWKVQHAFWKIQIPEIGINWDWINFLLMIQDSKNRNETIKQTKIYHMRILQFILNSGICYFAVSLILLLAQADEVNLQGNFRLRVLDF